ncbi:MAG: sulfatase-like hydrolase/transferase [Rubripirellula sp.]
MKTTLQRISRAAAVLAAGLVVSPLIAAKPKPNVVLILTDDLGWQDVKCYDIDEPSPMETPNIDALAKKGVMFWQAYSPAPTCAPSRCAIMSGNHPARAQKTHVVGGAPPSPNNRHSRMMDPWYSGRMPAGEQTLAKTLTENGYFTGHVGKWHMAIDHNSFPQPEDQGFDFTRSNRGAQTGPKDRLTGFATDAEDDPYRLDANGFPYHQNNEDALAFIRENQDKPFFLYYATWLVHAPIHTRSKALLDKYAERLGVDPSDTYAKEVPGQQNPFYCAMVEMLDYYVGQVFTYLDETDDPRWPGHKLSENTYIIFTSDNGGMEGGPDERYTDNNPLDRGKISAKEGGTRVPLIVVGPGIAKGVQTDVLANGLDFYPTILSLTGSELPAGKHFDGCDLSNLLHGDPANPTLVKDADGQARDTMTWHFPHGVALESTIRVGDYKLIRNYDHVNNDSTPELELFQLYETKDGKQQRVDIEEAKNLASAMPEKTATMSQELAKRLTEMNASYPYYNPNCDGDLPGKDAVCTVVSHAKDGDRVTFTYQENGAKVVRADLLYTLNGGQRYEEWFRKPANLLAGMKVSAELPEGTTHFVLNLVDENQFLRSYPEINSGRKGKASASALSTLADNAEGDAVMVPSAPESKPIRSRKSSSSSSFAEKDTNKDERLSQEEYVGHGVAGFDRKDKDKDGFLAPSEHSHPSFEFADQDKNEQLTREEFASIFQRQFDSLDKDNSGFVTADEMKR